ncbi:hypothetical protein F511_24264 [Dorcoceras hygrometricum]|uniref:Uncharacterized protein n=1 Tax=Dorcoceras hygrometricum TaxID=472368 RepID=A0A2Z7CCV5_9LAMI|nr:hypothetical protein F511_24264 [Dorcoceras hygrometricum]
MFPTGIESVKPEKSGVPPPVTAVSCCQCCSLIRPLCRIGVLVKYFENNEDDVVQPSLPKRRCARQVDAEVPQPAHKVDKMELVLATFQMMNPPTFSGAEGGSLAKGWLEHMEGLFDRVKYDEHRKLSLTSVVRACVEMGERYFQSYEKNE